MLHSLKSIAPNLFTIALAPEYDLAEEQLSFEHGADLYFAEPLPERTLQHIISLGASGAAHINPAHMAPKTEEPRPSGTSSGPSALHILRDFSNILGFSPDYKTFTQHFILKLREHISFSRIGIFLEGSAKQSFVNNGHSNHLECIASLGLPADLVDCFQLNREIGIGRTLTEQPRILQANRGSRSPFEEADPTIRKEFNILGCHLAVPITDRERSIGVAVLNGPVTGRDYNEEELQLLYLLMEELGLAIRNSRLHAELASRGQLIENVLQSMSSGAIVISDDLHILYTNPAAKRFLKIEGDSKRLIDFAELPPRLAGPAHRAIEKGELPEPFAIAGLNQDELYQISIIPFSEGDELALLPRPVMVIIEDFTKIEANKQTALEDSKSQLISLIAKRFAHEIRNSLVPLTTHMQLMDKKIEQPKFQASLKSAMQRETGRIKRFSEQMLYLAQNSNPSEDNVDLETAILESFRTAHQQISNQHIQLNLENTLEETTIHGNPEGITYAFEELFLNSIQAHGASEAPITVTIRRNDEGILTITIRDDGPGFDPATLENVSEPFFSTRNTGVGLGLSVAKKIIEEHHGFIQTNLRSAQADWDIKIELPSTLIPHTHTL